MTRDEIKTKIIDDENIYEKILAFNVKNICESNDIKFVLVAGPSCSGKTTTARKICDMLLSQGKIVYTISLDDFYLAREQCPVMEDGKIDFECVESLDLAEIQKCMSNLARELPAEIPIFSFKEQRRLEKTNKIVPSDKDIYIIEGLHALNTQIFGDAVQMNQIYRIYLDSFSESGVRKAETRLVRRIVRDFYHRSTKAEQTFDMWENVAKSEDKYIRPYAESAEGCVNTYFKYEHGVLKKYASMILGEIKEDDEYYKRAQLIIMNLQNYETINPEAVPKDSLMQEFIPPTEEW